MRARPLAERPVTRDRAIGGCHRFGRPPWGSPRGASRDARPSDRWLLIDSGDLRGDHLAERAVTRNRAIGGSPSIRETRVGIASRSEPRREDHSREPR